MEQTVRAGAFLRATVRCAVLALTLTLTACQTPPGGGADPDRSKRSAPGATSGAGGTATTAVPEGATAGPAAPKPNRPEVRLPPPQTPRSWTEARAQAARRLMAANPDNTYTGKPPRLLLAIPVLTVELHADGSVRHVSVMRHPSQAHDAVKLATEAIHRAAPFGDVSRLPKPWRFNETFLFDDELKFKPMTLNLP